MKTPICDFVRDYRDKNTLRLHMPGHKGRGTLGIEALDLTEIDGADVLYAPTGIILESETYAAELFGTERTVYSTEGSTLSIRAMLYLALMYGKEQGRTPTVLASRNAHRSFMSGCALLDIDVKWLFGEDTALCRCKVDRDELDAALCQMERVGELPAAVYLTSPDYLGNLLPIGELADVCHKYGVLCLVDNAHGAYLAFLGDRHPMSCGADMCADSAHKTLPVLTGGGYLHISKSAPKMLSEYADQAMALFASTSPSYLILQSLDSANAYLDGEYRERLSDFANITEGMKQALLDAGYILEGDEPLKLTLKTKSYGYTGNELCEILSDMGIVCEFCDDDYAVMMLTLEIGEAGIDRLTRALLSIPKRECSTECAPAPKLPRPKRAMGIREALMSSFEELRVEESVGRILANAALSCPPAVPVVVCGEIIDEESVRAMKYYGIEKCFVIKQR